MTTARAAGLKMLAKRLRKTYLLTTAIADVAAATYHGSYGLRIIAMIKPVSTAPLGNSQALFLFRIMKTSINPATRTALTSSGPTSPICSCLIANAVRIANTISRSPFGVRKNRRIAPLAMPRSSRFEPLQRRTDDQSFDADPFQQLDPFGGSKDKSCR